jgi:hypothetical protein
MKMKYLLQIFVLLAVLFSALGTGQQAQAQSGTVQIVMRSLTLWDAIYTGYVDTTRYEKWPLTLTEAVSFTVTATPTSGGPAPLLLLLDSSSNEISRSVGSLTSSRPVGSYYIQVQPEGTVGGAYSLTIRETQQQGTNASVTVTLNPASITVGGTSTATVSLNNVPATGYASVEFTCTYDPAFVEVSNIVTDTDLFGADPAVAVNGPAGSSFIVAIAGSNGNKVVQDGAAFTFTVRGLQAGQTPIDCSARASTGNGILTALDHTGATLTITPAVVNGTLTGTVIASKLVTVRLLNANQTEAASTTADAQGNFSLTAPAGSYTVTASAEGFLRAQGTATLIVGATTTAQEISLPAGDIDGNGVIDQFDAMTIGMNYNLPIPAAADLNNDANINVLDLELLAGNYRDVGPINWIIPQG